MSSETRAPGERDLLERVDAALPIDDVVGWLIREYPSASEQEVMRMLQDIYQGGYAIGPSGAPEQRYEFGDNSWTAFPQQVSGKQG